MKKLIKILFHRVTYTLMTIALQLGFFVAAIIKFNDYFIIFYVASMFISILAVLYIINSTSNPAYKIAWIVPILIFPVFGGLFYLLYGRNRLNVWTKRKMICIGCKMKEFLIAKEPDFNAMGLVDEAALNQSKYISGYSFCPPYDNTEVEYLPLGEDKYKKLMEELKKAQRFIFLEYFIIDKGIMWDSILEILAEKAKAGVDVRVIYDDVGCLFTLPNKYNKTLEKMGIKCCVFNPMLPVLTARLNNRDHRKIAVIDGHTGFTGGINLADEYINAYDKYGHWKDTAVMLKGEAVWSLTVMFLTMWDYLKGTDEDYSKFKYCMASCRDGQHKTGFVQPFADSPFDNEPVGEIVYLNLINKAKRYIYITTPYLIINNEMVTALTMASKGGVDVRIITPHHPDKLLVHKVTRSYYRELMESGIKIYEYTPGFMHSKSLVADDEYGFIGSINLDYRSLFLHFECGVWMYRNSCIKDIKEDFLAILDKCEMINLDDIRHEKWYKKLGSAILRVFSPLM